MNRLKKTFVFALMPMMLLSCAKPRTNEEALRLAYLDVIEATSEKIRPLANLSKDDPKVRFNEAGDKVLLFTFHRFPSSYPEGETIVTSWGESWLCSPVEYESWYESNKGNIEDLLLRTKQVLGMSHESKNTYISTLWFHPADIVRPAYVTDPTKPMALSFSESTTDEYKNWFSGQYYYSYDVAHLPWTRLGYTYDWSQQAKDRYGLSEFLAWKGTSATVERTCLVTEYFAK